MSLDELTTRIKSLVSNSGAIPTVFVWRSNSDTPSTFRLELDDGQRFEVRVTKVPS